MAGYPGDELGLDELHDLGQVMAWSGRMPPFSEWAAGSELALAMQADADAEAMEQQF